MRSLVFSRPILIETVGLRRSWMTMVKKSLLFYSYVFKVSKYEFTGTFECVGL